MSEMLDDIEFHIAKLSMEKDDILVVRLDRPSTSIAVATMTARLQHQFGVKVLVIDSTIELSTISKSEAAKVEASVHANAKVAEGKIDPKRPR